MGKIQGVVGNKKSGEKIDEVLVVIQCSCLKGTRVTRTNPDGLYSFTSLPPGNYTIQVLAGTADVTRTASLKAGHKVRSDFKIDPNDALRRT
ncbi:MAG: carboxypeptidase-like regulatory domain-containing protein [Nannocystaceae bacterium]